MRLIYIVLLIISFNGLAVPIKEITCPAYEEQQANLLDPDKRYVKYTEKETTQREYLSYDLFYKFIQKFPNEEYFLIELDEELKSQTSSLVAYKYTFYDRQYTNKEQDQFAISTQRDVPSVQYATPHGILSGSNLGEFGGKLIYVDKNQNITKLAEMNVEDIYYFSGGYVIISGLAHMGAYSGNIHYLELTDNGFHLQKLHGLVSTPRHSWKINSKEIFITSFEGNQILHDNGALIGVRCKI